MYKYVVFIFVILSVSLQAQSPLLYQLENNNLVKADQQFEEQLYAAAARSYQDVIDEYAKKDNPTDVSLISRAEIGKARSSMKLGFIEAPSLLENVINKYFPKEYCYNVTMDLANYYFNERDFVQAKKYYKMLDKRDLSKAKREELAYKLGYSHFVKKEFAKAENYFSRPISKSSPYFVKHTYYSGMVAYFTRDYKNALTNFRKVEQQTAYKSHVPYYICQIYFAQEQYDELINYGEKLLRKPNVKNENDINLLLGQAYFIQKDYKNALPYLWFYETNNKKLSEDEFYQLGYAQYKLKHYDDAIDNFKELSSLENEMGVMSNYYLGDSYMKVGDRVSARSAFKFVSQNNLVPSIQEEALFNYAKLSAELGHDREAINNLIKFSDNSSYKEEAQSILSNLLLSTKDYTNAIRTIEGFNTTSDEVNQALVKLYYLRALQLYNDGMLRDSEAMFQNVIRKGLNKNYSQQANYYHAMIAHRNGEIDKSIELTESYINAPVNGMPDETNMSMAYYLQANNYLAKLDYNKALVFFEKGIVSSSEFRNATMGERLKSEMIIRAADCAFQTQQRDNAAKNYQLTIDKKDHNYVYANYQLGIIRGLEAKPYDKIVLLEKITESDSNDDLVDDALMQLGDTYLSLQKFNKAFSSYKSIIQKHKNSRYLNQAFLKLGLIAYNQGDVTDALTFYKEIFNNNPNPKEIQQALLSIQEIYVEDLGQAEEYVLFSEEVAGHKISDFAKDSLHYSIAYNQYKNAKYQVAVEKFDRYLKKFDNGFYMIPAHYYRGESHTLVKSYTAALEDYKSVIDVGQGEYLKKSLRKAAVISYSHAEDFESALKYYKLMETHAQSTENMYEAILGALQSSYRTNNHDDIIAYASKLSQHQLVSDQDKVVASFYAGKSYYLKGLFEKAIPMLNQVVRMTSNEKAAESKFLLADIFYQKKLYDKAQTQCLDISDNTSNYPYWVAKSLILLADVLVEETDFFNAKAALEAVIEHYQDDKELLKSATDKLEEVKEKESVNSRLKEKKENGELEMD